MPQVLYRPGNRPGITVQEAGWAGIVTACEGKQTGRTDCVLTGIGLTVIGVPGGGCGTGSSSSRGVSNTSSSSSSRSGVVMVAVALIVQS
jgi:hypothetical protein